MTRVTVDPGICGFPTTIEVTKLSPKKVKVDISSDCEMVASLGSQLSELDSRDALRSHGRSAVYECAFRQLKHVACPVPAAILKAIEVELGAALPRDVSIRFESHDHT
jgi:hypothetical protein